MSYQADNMAFNDAMDSISHYGTKGMSWGKWNEDTRKRYEGEGKTSASEVIKEGTLNHPAIEKFTVVNNIIEHYSGVNVADTVTKFATDTVNSAVNSFEEYRQRNIENSRKGRQ